MTAYRYVLYNMNAPYFEPMLAPLGKLANVRIYEGPNGGKGLLGLLFRTHWSHKLNHGKLRMPFKRIWYKSMYGTMQDDTPTCFVFFGAKFAAEDRSFLTYIKRQNPQNRIVFAFGDLIAKRRWAHQDTLFAAADLVVSYDPSECTAYGMTYWEDRYYSTLLPVTHPDAFDCDLFFLGYAKDRLDDIHAVWRCMTEAGVRCRFLVAGTTPEQRLSGEGLTYIETPISYRESLALLNRARCVLELVQGRSTATTMRTLEAVTYKRKLLSNCPTLQDSTLYCDANMQTFSDPSEIDAAFLKSPIDYDAYERVSPAPPAEFLDFLASHLKGDAHA